MMLGAKAPNYDACGLFRAAHSHNPAQYSHIVGYISHFYAHIGAGPKNIVTNPELNMNFSREVKQDAQNPSHFWLTLGTNITDKQKDAVVINLSLVGEFIVSADKDSFDIWRLIKENGVAILFPYLRSELTLLTTQPGFQPIVLPAVNIAKMFQN